MEPEAQIAIVGAGAAGLWAAERAARAGRRVLLLEKTPRTGTKVLASGGTRCNLTTTLPPREAARLFGPRGARFLETAFRLLPPAAVRERFAAWGVATVEAPLEKVFPASGRARDVRDALEAAARGAGAEIRLGSGVRSILRDGAGWLVRLEGDRSVRAAKLVLAPGGRSYASTGTTGDGYAWAAELGLPLVRPVPALVPLTSPAAWVGELAGISVQEAVLSLHDTGGRELGRRARPVLFTHQGLSGPAALDLSEPVARAAAEGSDAAREVEFTARIDLLPGITREALREALIAGAARPGAQIVGRVLPFELPRRLVAASCRQAGLSAEPRAAGLSKAERHALVEALKGLCVPIGGTLGFDRAEVTAGGLDLAALDPGSLRVRGAEGLFAIGEMLDLQGPIGGLNFQSAFATAELAARAAAEG